VTINPDGLITDVNRATEQVTGRTRQQLVGADFSSFFTEPDTARAGYQVVLARGEVRDYPLTIRHASGQTTDVLYNASVYRNPAGQVQGVFAAARDITERQRAEAERGQRLREEAARVEAERGRAELEAAYKELEAFSYSVSHDLRAPLRAVDGFSRILLDDYLADLSGEAKDYLLRVRANTERMGQLIDDLLAFSRLSRQPLAKQTIQPADVVHHVWDDLRAEWDARRVDVVIGDLPACEADPRLLRQVWLNLLSNALKFTRRREAPRIEVGSERQNADRAYFVKDNGVGFDMRYADKLFGVFQRLHSSEDYEGTGVGLAIVQRIIHRHGGRVWAEAAVDNGATFYFTLP
jgi:PAS domain S-box-containing protein